MKKPKLLYITLFLFLIIYFKPFENIYLVSKYNIDERLINNYGYCGGVSYGFIKYIDNKYKPEKNLKIYNEDKSYPYSEAFIHKPKKKYIDNFLIVLNYNDLNSSIDIKNYTIIEKFQNCFYLKKND